MIYNIDFDVSALFISALSIFCVISTKRLKKFQNKIFFFILVTVFLSIVFDIASSYANSFPLTYSRALADFYNYSFLILHNIFPMVFAFYIIAVFGIYHKANRTYWMLFLVPVSFSMVLFILNPFLHELFYYNEAGIYTHASMFICLYIDAFAYLLLSGIYMVIYGGIISKLKLYSLMTFLGSAFFAVVIQMRHPLLLVELFIESLSLFGILFTIESEDEMLNAITKTYNRKALINDGSIMIRNGSKCEVLVVKISNMNYLNATFGVVAINKMLYDIVEWLNVSMKGTNVYDCENGHFAMTVYRNESKEEYIKKISERFEKEWLIGSDMNISLHMQLCVLNVPEDISDIDKLLLIIDTPLEKVLSSNEIIHFEQYTRFQREVKIEKAIRHALAYHTLKVYYQPIWSYREKKIRSAEALARLFDDELGFVPPDEFIPLAEKNGMINEIGEYVFEEVCRFYNEKKLDEIGIDYVEVNLSVIQCMNKNIVETLSAIADKYGVNPKHINLEITESAFANNANFLTDMLKSLKEHGFSLSMDDYGTGYSNFSYMFDTPFQIIKLDKSILWSSDNNERAAIILKNTIHMIQEMKLESLVEGVETEQQKKMLSELECDFHQGYFYSRPVDGDKFYEYCKTYNLKAAD